MNDDPKKPRLVTSANAGAVPQPVIDANAKLEAAMAILLVHTKRQARLRKAAYDAYLAEGFTPAQALELCRHP